MKNIFKILAVSTLTALAIVSSSCGLLTASTLTQTSTVTAPAATTTIASSGGSSGFLDFSAVVEKVRPSVVQVETDIAAGSGWVVDASGIIVTNAHVLEDAGGVDQIKVITSDGKSYIATSIKTDVSSDLAIIRINASGLTAASIGSSAALKVGQPVAAIGNALSLGISMTGGWVSRLNATVTDENGVTYVDLIGTDTAINFGNSGGPLVNTSGQVVGITSIKLIEEGVEGVGYAIAIDSAMPIIQQLINSGYVARAFMGVNGLTTVDSIVAAQNNLGTNSGVMIGGVVAGSPADKAGLKAKDVITAVDGTEITTNGQLVRLIQAKAPGTQVKITFYRGTSKSTVTVTLGSTPPPTQ
ncbi:MAG: PDZ domain-containing protein [Dehalococcoidia bacterium]|nr:MAG: PDZ domain-containing protein [Dehalococcoidia bacterium]